MTSVWVIGASSGIGQALADWYAQQDVILYLSSRQISAAGPRWDNGKADIRLRPLDLQQPAACNAVTNAILEEGGAPDLVFFAAGMIAYDDCWHMTPDLERRLFEVNYWGPVTIAQGLMEPMIRRQSGQLVFLGSISGFVASPLRSTYSASKHALQGYVNAVRAELSRFHITVTLVCPGFVDTGIDQRAMFGNGELRNSRDENRLSGISPQECAQQIVKGIGLGKEELIIGGRELIMLPLQRFFPGTVRRLLPGFRPHFSPPASEFANLPSGVTEYYLYGRGPIKLVITNGFTSSFEVWWDVLRELNPDKYQVLLYNYYGRGESRANKQSVPLNTFDIQLDEMLGFMAWQPQDCVWVSYSWGCGWLNRWFLQRDVVPKSLVMVAPAYWNEQLLKPLDALRFSSLGKLLFSAFGKWMLYADYRRYCNTPFIAKAFWKRIAGYVSRRSFIAMFVEQLTDDLEQWPVYFKNFSALQTSRICVIRGTDDGKSMGADSDMLGKTLEVDTVIDIKGVSHLLPLEASLTVARHMDHFISSQVDPQVAEEHV